MKVLVYNEGFHDTKPEVKAIYPNGIHGRIAEMFTEDGHEVVIATVETVEEVFTEELVKSADLICWWGHIKHHLVPDAVAERVQNAVLGGCGFIALHSAHLSKPFKRLMGTACTLRWRDDDRERIWVTAPSHPIAQGIPESFELESEEMYGEYFDIPTPDEIVFMGWFAGGEVFRSGCTFTRGLGKIFYFQPGHETFPSFNNEYVTRIIKNAGAWACKKAPADTPICIHAAESPESLRK